MKDKLNVVVIGVSIMGQRHAEGVNNHPNAVLYGICDKHPEILEAAQNNVHALHTTTDYMDFVNDPAVDAAVIVTPDKLHKEMAVNFMRAGKDVLCEKPMSLFMEECQEMMQAEHDTGRKLMIGQICRCTDAFIQAKELVDAGRIGELVYVESEYAHDYAHASRGVDDWRLDPDRHGFIGGACHAVDLLRWVAGDPITVAAYANHKILMDWPVDDFTIAIYRFPNNVIGKVFCSIGCQRDYTMRSAFYGTKGTIICDNTSDTMKLYTNYEPLPDGTINHDIPQILPVTVNNHNTDYEIRIFVDALLRGDETMPVPSREGAYTVAACRATVDSAKQGKEITIPYPVVK